MHISLIEPFYRGSHRQWADTYQQYSQHQVKLYTLPGRHWKWRMHGGAVALAKRFMASSDPADMLLATDMLDLSAFLALTRTKTARLPTAIYFHENQLTYPWSPDDRDVSLKRDNHYGFINYSSALVADRVYFNSHWHKHSFIDGLDGFLSQFPDHQGKDTIQSIKAKSDVLYLGMDLKGMQNLAVPERSSSPVILWNHRWEYDKGPEAFFDCLYRLDKAGADFQLIVLGKAYQKLPPVFDTARTRLAHRILHWGFVDSRAVYFRLLKQADLLPVTSRQDFFGGSVVEAIYAGCYPLLPDRLAYPEHLPEELRDRCIYKTDEELFQKLLHLLKAPPSNSALSIRLQNFVARYDWSILAAHYDSVFKQLTAS